MKATLVKKNITAVKNIAYKYRHQHGFSLLEVTVVFFIFGITSILCVYFYSNTKNNNQAKIITNKIKDNLIFAKHYAIKNNTNIFICPSSNFINCDNHWEAGYIIYRKASAINNTSNKNTIVAKCIFKNLSTFTLNLYMFGNSSINHNNILAISKDGTTYNNGHFLYSDSTGSKNVYWNKQLRFYIK